MSKSILKQLQDCRRIITGLEAKLSATQQKLEAAEAKSKAVPEGWQLVPKIPNDAQLRVIEEMLTNCHGIEESYFDIIAAASPQPDRDSNE